jgi:menaquinone-dependent protoporphyrinogen oxidase
MRVLVAAGSRYGATMEIAEAIWQTLVGRGVDADVENAEAVRALEAYDAVVLGGAVYSGGWVRSARDLADRVKAELPTQPLWLFSSGPVGALPSPDEVPAVVAAYAHFGAVEHQVFPGKLDRSRLRPSDKAIAVALSAPDGDYRDWEDIRAWANRIADALHSLDARP